MDTHYPAYETNRDGLRNALTVIFKHKYKVATVLLLAVAAALAASFLLPPLYEAESSVLIKIGREYLNRSESGDTKPVQLVSNEQVINSEIEIVTNDDLVKAVITRLKVAKLYPDLAADPPPDVDVTEAAAVKFKKKLKVEGVKKSNVLKVSFRHRDPVLAALAVNTLVDLYKEKHLQVYSDPKSSFLEKQLEAYQQKLRQSEGDLQGFKQRTRVYSIEEQRSLLLKQRSELEATTRTSEHSIVELQKRVRHLKGQLKEIAESKTRYTTSERDRILVEAKAKLLGLQLEEQELLKKYTAANHLVANARKEAEIVKNFIREQEEDNYVKSKSGNMVYQNVEMELIKAETELAAQQGKVAALRRQLGQMNGEIQQLDLNERELQVLKRDQAINEKNYQTYIAKAEEARIVENMDRQKLANISVIQNASPPIKPVRPRKALYLLLGLVAGAVAGVGTAFAAEAAAGTISTPAAAESRLGVPVLATIGNEER